MLLTVEEGNQLISCPLSTEGKSNCREPVDRVESEQDIVVLAEEEFQSQHHAARKRHGQRQKMKAEVGHKVP